MSFLTEPIELIPSSNLRSIESFLVRVVLSENTNDTLTITKQPVQQGASITDHAYKEPTTLSMTAYFSDKLGVSLKDLYEAFRDLQSGRVPFTVVTPKRTYNNMLMATLVLSTDKNTENTLALSMSFQEIIIVKVSTTQVPRLKQKNPGATAATEKAGRKSSFLNTGKEAIVGLFSKVGP